MNNNKLTITAIKFILTGFALLLLVLTSIAIQLLQSTIKTIAIGIKLLNEWCDAHLSDIAETATLSGFKPVAYLNSNVPKSLITPPILPSSGVVIVPVTQNAVIAAKKRGRTKKPTIA